MTNWQVDAFVRELRRLWPDVHETAGWRTRSNRTSFIAGGPIGTVNHHTVSGSDNGAVNTIINGWTGVSGPIYNVLVLSTGAVHLIAAGPANHAGRGRTDVRDRARRDQAPPGATAARGDDMNGNQTWFGIAARHVGTNPDYPARQIDGIVAVNAAFMLARGFSANRAIHHRQWTARKIDMSWRGDLIARVNAAMRGGGTPTPPAPPSTPPATPPAPRPPTTLLEWIMTMPGAPANMTFDQFLDRVANRVWSQMVGGGGAGQTLEEVRSVQRNVNANVTRLVDPRNGNVNGA